jgi:hypothetical protein
MIQPPQTTFYHSDEYIHHEYVSNESDRQNTQNQQAFCPRTPDSYSALNDEPLIIEQQTDQENDGQEQGEERGREEPHQAQNLLPSSSSFSPLTSAPFLRQFPVLELAQDIAQNGICQFTPNLGQLCSKLKTETFEIAKLSQTTASPSSQMDT